MARSEDSLASCSTSTDSSSDDAFSQLSNVKLLKRLMHDVVPVPEPNVPDRPVVRIQYNPNFDYVMGLYRAIHQRAIHQGLVIPVDVARLGCRLPARWLLLLAFALRQCTSHYTVWRDRRELVLHPHLLSTATYEAYVSAREDGVDLTTVDKEELRELDAIARYWLPTRVGIHLPSPRAEETGAVPEEPTVASVSIWRAVRWELETVHCVGRLYHKNFQIWHHRRELLSRALATIPQDEQASLLTSELAFSDFLVEHHRVAFHDLDERNVCADVLGSADAKNYHVWLHRSWYVHAFAFLVQPPSWEALQSFVNADGALEALKLPAFEADPTWAASGCLLPTIPTSPLAEEMSFAATLIQEDSLNNSAWCHRYYLFHHDVVEPLLRNLAEVLASAGSDASEPRHDGMTVSAVASVLTRLCMLEMHYALQWAIVEPGNESAFVHAKSVADLHQSAMLRLAVVRISNDTSARKALLASHLQTPVATVQGERVITVEGAAPPPSRDETSPASVLQHMTKKLSWDEYWATFALHTVQQEVLRQHVEPVVRHREAYVERLLGVTDAKEKASALGHLHERSAQLLIDKLSQVYAAQYHIGFRFLQQTWTLFLEADEREAVRAARPPEVYATAGITPDMLQPIDKETKGVLPCGVRHPAVASFLVHEAATLEMAKRLVFRDAIRSKYWKHEILLVMQRGY